MTAEQFEQPATDDRPRLVDATGNVIRAELLRRWRELSPLGRAYGRLWDGARADTATDLITLWRVDADLIEVAANEYFRAFPEFEVRPPRHGQASP